MRWLALPAGIVLLFGTMLDVFRTMVMPRAARGRFRLTRVLFVTIWRPWRWVGVRQKTAAGRERVLSFAAPLTLFILLNILAYRHARAMTHFVSGGPKKWRVDRLSALQKLDNYSKRIPLQASPNTAHMFIVQPFSGQAFMNLFSTHPPIQKRIERLQARSRP